MSDKTPEPTIEILGQIKTVDGETRLIGRQPDGKYVLGELGTNIGFDGKTTQNFARITPAMSFADLARCAENILAGNQRAMTWPHATLTLALGFAAISCEFQFPSAAGSAAPSPAEAAASDRTAPSKEAGHPPKDGRASPQPSQPSEAP